MPFRIVIFCLTLAFFMSSSHGQAVSALPDTQQEEDCTQLRDRLLREASRGGGRGLERYCDDCGRGGGPGYRVVQMPGQGVAGSSADDIENMSCEELQNLEGKRQEIAAGIEEASDIDIQRQIEEQSHSMIGRRDWDREIYEDPESDYWHIQGDDPRTPSFDQQLEDLGTAIRAAFGIGDGGVPETLPSTGPPPGVKPHPALLVLDMVSKAVSVVGEVGIARDRRYHSALQRAETDLETKYSTLSSQLARLEHIADYTEGRPGGEVVRRAIRDLQIRKAVVSDRLRAISGSRDRLEQRLRHYYENSPKPAYHNEGI